ncbi:MATE family efflux transporter [Pseudaestuariivita rosea]|uniref:MATE family efflux transporter n=1 Tax=Pseudaestuariivita rosea TaxID=2763263 RepID=UPI001ABA94C6|nr:MATE family efflux transporter [Pseudaestuariivita rosea]
MSGSQNLTQGPLWRAIAVVSAPMSIGILAVLSIGLADAVFLGRYSSTALSAVGFIYPVTTAITSLAIGLSAGANAAISQSIGAEDGSSNRLAVHAIGISLALSVAVAMLVWLATPLIFRTLGAGDAVFADISGYMFWWVISFPFLVLMMVINAAFRADGDSVVPAGMMVLAAVVNIALDPILIFGWGMIPELGTQGAGLATLAARIAAAVGAVAFMIWSPRLCWPKEPLKNLVRSARRILSVGLPAAFSNAINPAGMAIVTGTVAWIGETAVAGFGAATRVQSFVLVPMLALSAGIGPVVGQNWGAKEKGRACGSVVLSFNACVAYGLTIGVLLILTAPWIAALITPDENAQSYTISYLRIVGLSLFGYGIMVVGNAALNARDKALWSMGVGLIRIAAVYAPFAALGAWAVGYTGIMLAAVAANLAGAALAIFACYKNDLMPKVGAPIGKFIRLS